MSKFQQLINSAQNFIENGGDDEFCNKNATELQFPCKMFRFGGAYRERRSLHEGILGLVEHDHEQTTEKTTTKQKTTRTTTTKTIAAGGTMRPSLTSTTVSI
jgi:hypothetical protein